MGTPLPPPLQMLCDIGLMQAATAGTSTVPETQVAAITSAADGGSLAGSLGAGLSLRARPGPIVPKRQPSLFWKALGFCLKSRFTSSSSLLDDNRALFLAEPDQSGIPAGITCPEQVTNYQVFLYADTMQQVNRPTFSLSGSSYFEFLYLYFKHVGGEDETKELRLARQALLDAKALKDRVWEADRSAFAEQAAQDLKSQESFVDYVSGERAYNMAWKEEEAAEQAFAELQKLDLKRATEQLSLLRLADVRLEPQDKNNMPVITTDQDWIRGLKADSTLSAKDLVDPKNIYYRPEHRLPKYQAAADEWISRGDVPSRIERDGPYSIPLANIWEESWADLGHPLLDEAQPREKLTDDQKDFINSIDASITFLQKPYVGNVGRGMWDFNRPRERFQLQPNAPRVLDEPICKTTKLIMAWGVQIDFILPEMAAASLVRNITLAAMNMPLKAEAGNRNKLSFLSGADSFPVLVGALADVV